MKISFTHILLVSIGLILSGCTGEQAPAAGEEEKTLIPEATSLLGDPLFSSPPGEELLEKYAQREWDYLADSNNVDKLIWYGRFTAYAGWYRDAIAIYSRGIERFPDDPRLYRHRGHRYISTRQLDKAIADFKKAVQLIDGKPNEVEPDGMPNAQNIPVSTLHGNIWYHLGLAYYLKQDMENALEAYKNCLASTRNDDNVVSSTHWLYMILRRMGRVEEADSYLDPISENMDIIENFSYQKACLLYKGTYQVEDLLEEDGDSSANDALTYAIGNWYLYNGDKEKSGAMYRKMLDRGTGWASFGFIAAESDWKAYFKSGPGD